MEMTQEAIRATATLGGLFSCVSSPPPQPAPPPQPQVTPTVAPCAREVTQVHPQITRSTPDHPPPPHPSTTICVIRTCSITGSVRHLAHCPAWRGNRKAHCIPFLANPNPRPVETRDLVFSHYSMFVLYCEPPPQQVQSGSRPVHSPR